MTTYIIAYVSAVIVFLGADYLWLSKIAIGFYRSRVGDLLMAQPNFAAAGAFYLAYIVGIVYFAVVPALNSGTWVTAAVAGALLGFIAYGTYDMTNLSTLKGWSLSVSLIDMAWGTVLTGVTATVAYLVASRFAA
ncbi:DUF2177 family protein [Agrobacterium sp. ES01]|uniref:DUF2177 family protein n=1 Tax=Agrobacterium sp. ES01 TaxID=3420714 RepID=UPI003D0EEC7F